MEQYHAALHAEHVFNSGLGGFKQYEQTCGFDSGSSSPSITYVGSDSCSMRVVDPSRPPSFTCCTYLHEKSDEAKVLSSELKEGGSIIKFYYNKIINNERIHEEIPLFGVKLTTLNNVSGTVPMLGEI